MPQHIICIASHVIDDALKQDGFIRSEADVFDPNHLWVGPRPILEEDESFKQIIPYVVLSHQGKIAVYQRTKQGGENRLHNMHSIGFGGHMDAFDLVYSEQGEIQIQDTIDRCAQRELDEELNIGVVTSRQRLGYIIDRSNPVGRVHVGAVELWELASDDISSNEDEITVLGFYDPRALQDFDGAMENWSEHIIGGLAD